MGKTFEKLNKKAVEQKTATKSSKDSKIVIFTDKDSKLSKQHSEDIRIDDSYGSLIDLLSTEDSENKIGEDNFSSCLANEASLEILDGFETVDDVWVEDVKERKSRASSLSHALFRASPLDFDADMVTLTTESSDSYVMPELESTEDFFAKLGKVQDIENTSILSSSSIYMDLNKKLRKIKDGRFVNPLTGLASESDNSLNSLIEEAEEEHLALDEKSTNSSDFLYDDFSLGEIDDMYTDESVASTVVNRARKEEHAITLWADSRRITEEPLPTITVPQEPAAPKIHEDTLKFFEKIIELAVRRFEEKRDERFLRDNLNKNELFKHLFNLFNDLSREKYVHVFLIRKATHYYRRKGSEIYFYGDFSRDFERYQISKLRLNKLLGQESAMLKKTTIKIDELMKTLNQREKLLKEAKEDFEHLVRRVLVKDDKPKLATEVTKGLKEIAKLRTDISEVRSEVIQRQHVLSTLDQKIEKLQTIGDGLYLQDFEHFLAQIDMLSKKLEDRLQDLTKSHTKLQKSSEILCHMKMHSRIIYNNMEIQSSQYRELIDELVLCRINVHALKLKHVKNKEKLNEMHYRMGLLGKPVLLKDYDETTKQVNEKLKAIEFLRTTRNELELKLKNLICKSESEDKMKSKSIREDKVRNIKGDKGLESFLIVKGIENCNIKLKS